MSMLLDSLCGAQRLAECAATDPRPSHVSEAEWIAADEVRARSLPQRIAEEVRTAHQLDVDAIRRAGL